MGSKICMNAACGAATSVEWKKGWALRSGGFATLCFNCGYAYENLAFCDTFHLEETGWRECSICKKHLHCGCIASKSLLELLEFGGVGCTSCARSHQPHPIRRNEVPNDIDTSTLNNIGNTQSTLAANLMDADTFSRENLLHLGNIMKTSESSHFPQPRKGDKNSSNGIIKREDAMNPIGELAASFPSLIHPSVVSSKFSKPNNSIPIVGVKDMYESLCQPSLSIALSTPSETPNVKPAFPGMVFEEREHNKAPSPFQQGQRSRPILPKPSKIALSIGSDANKGIIPQVRVARPPAEGRGRNQLLPRYWPRITDQELQQLSGDLNSTIVPLFEKVLSASDAGRIGRLVLPKACAEAFFPPVTQSEGLPVRIQDAKGKEWTFQFRFWPNNNSRMYVLEGVTPCIQSMQLQAGDTVTFSRIDPEGKLVIGSRKASGIVDMQDGETSTLPNGALPGEMSFSGVPTISVYSGIFQSPKECKDPHLNTQCEQLDVVNEDDVSWPKNEKLRGRPNDNAVHLPLVISEKKRTRNIGSKSKRLLMHSDDAMELRLTWEEAQDLLRPPPRVKPIIVTIEDHEFEEYDEPPVFGKRTLFTTRSSGEQEQWAQCDNCFKWRRLPVDFLLPSKWTCSDNVWDPNRCSCSAPDEMSPKEVESLFKPTKDFKRRRTTESHKVVQEHEPSGLDALASAAVLGDSVSDPGDGSVGATTKHPRHRLGCTCIVCIQPPSGKGKHKPTCTCNVCMSVKRRFKTMMLRKKIRQSEREAEIAQKDHINSKDESEMIDPSTNELLHTNHSENEITQSIIQAEVGETSKGQIDLNCQPDHREDVQREETGMSMISLVQVASFPLDNYLEQNGLASLGYEQQARLASASLPQGIQESEECLPDEIENGRESAAWERDNEGDERHREPDLGKVG